MNDAEAEYVKEVLHHLNAPSTIDIARKHDGSKVRFDLLPPDALTEIVQVLTYGAERYEARNWERATGQFDWGRLYAALQRHLWAWHAGEDNDPETGVNHLAHAGCMLLFLLAYQLRAYGVDDRGPDCTARMEVAYNAPK